ncbi:MAG: RNA polymerase sigma factor [Planctomycetes bacterium]|nr:RNA polymerase sigma factor [Planctomycetota bacterium]
MASARTLVEKTAAAQADVSDSGADAEDRALMRAVAEDRDRKAFARLFERHQTDAYNLARHLSPTREAAEDAVQEAMLRAWTSAATFRTDGSVRSWLLRIVAREAIRAYRRNSAESKRIEHNSAGAPRAAAAAQAAAAENREELAELRRTLAGLPERQRVLLALYFGAGLSQAEIGKELDMQQTTVSRAIHDLLAQLRGHLDRAGFAAAAPLLAAESLRSALLGSEPAPPGLADAVAHRIAEAGSALSGKAAAASAANAARAAFGAAAVVALAAGGWWWAAQTTAEGETQGPSAETQAETAQVPDKTTLLRPTQPLDYRWTFDGKLPPEIVAAADGKHRYAPTNSGRKGLFFEKHYDSGYAIRVPLPARPVHLRAVIEKYRKKQNMTFTYSAMKDGAVLPARVWQKDDNFWPMAEVQTIDAYVNEDWFFLYAGENLHVVRQAMRPATGSTLCFTGENIVLHSLEMREIDPAELPLEMKDPEATVKDLRVVVEPGTEVPNRPSAK